MTRSTRALLIIVFAIFCIAGLAGVTFLIVQMRPLRPSVSQYPSYRELQRFDPDREGGHLLPDFNGLVTGERVDQPVRWVTNSKGFRSELEYSYQPGEGVFRVLLLGDSYVDGMRTAQDKTIGAVLEAALNRAYIDQFHSAEVLISGHNNPANAWYYYQEHGKKYRPHVVILGVTLGNDLTWHSYRAGVSSERNASGRISVRMKPGAGQTGSELRQLLLPTEAYEAPRIWDRLNDREFSARRLLATRFDAFMYSLPPRLAPNVNHRRHVYAGGFHTSLGLFYQPLMPEIEQQYKDFEEVLFGFQQSVHEQGQELLVVLFPISLQFVDKHWSRLLRYYSLKNSAFDRRYPNRRIKRFCAEHNIRLLDMLDVLEGDFKGHGEPLYRPLGDMHFGERGQRIVAQALGDYLLSEDLLR